MTHLQRLFIHGWRCQTSGEPGRCVLLSLCGATPEAVQLHFQGASVIRRSVANQIDKESVTSSMQLSLVCVGKIENVLMSTALLTNIQSLVVDFS